MKSLWTETTVMPRFAAFDGSVDTDVLIIGGGMAGLLCAHTLSRAGVGCVVVEAARVCSGTTKNTTAKITAQHGLIYDKLIREFGIEKARLYLESNLAAVKKYRALCADFGCGFEEKSAYVYSINDPWKLEREVEALHRLGYGAELVTKLPLPFSVAGAVRFTKQAQFHPLEFAAKLAANLRVYENTFVRRLVGTTVQTDGGEIRAKKVIVATHFPFINTHGLYFLKMYQHRSYVLALKNAPDVDGMYMDEAKDGLSFRNAEGLLLLGGGAHKTGKKGGGWQELESFCRTNYPQASIEYRWAAQDCMTLDGAPYIGKYSKSSNDIYVATGFNKWGMTSSMVAAELLSDMVLGRKNAYAGVYSPSRTMLRPQLFINAAQAVAGLVTPTVPRCTHLGCALKWNKAEHSWDCPCHGSRFSREGDVIDNPAKKAIK